MLLIDFFFFNLISTPEREVRTIIILYNNNQWRTRSDRRWGGWPVVQELALIFSYAGRERRTDDIWSDLVRHAFGH